MGNVKKAERNKRTNAIMGFDAMFHAGDKIGNSFLRDRVRIYIDDAAYLLDQLSDKARSPADLRSDLDAYGKQARILDMILSVAGASGYLAPSDKSIAQSIRHSVERKLGAHVRIGADGVIEVSNGSETLTVKTHSPLGRGITRLFARVVPPSEADRSMASVPGNYLSSAAIDKINNNLEQARKFWMQGSWSEAHEIYKSILATDRKNPKALRMIGRIHFDSGNSIAAVDYLQQARLLDPDSDEIADELATALSRIRRYDEGIKIYREALAVKPDAVNLMIGFSVLHFLKGDDDEAVKWLERARTIAPHSLDLLAKTALMKSMHRDYVEAALLFSNILKAEPNNPSALAGLSNLRTQQQKIDEALPLIEQALKREPQNVEFLYIKSRVLLAAGRYSEGWPLYEHRAGRPGVGDTLLPGKPIWKGEAAPSKKLLIAYEQGLGDSIEFVRYAALSKKRVGKVYVLCQKPLQRLFEQCPYIDKVFTQIAPWRFDEQIRMMSLPMIFGTTLETVPSDIPYLFVPPGMQKKMAALIASPGAKLKVGLVWAGSTYEANLRGDLIAKRRNAHLQQLMPLFDLQDVAFCSLQMGKEAAQIDDLGLRGRIIDPTPKIADMLDTAAIISNLDLVISVDTSVAHLTGALGKPLWVMSRYDACWRWLQNRVDSPWYPTARIFGQPTPGDWDFVVREVRDALKVRLANA